MMRKARRTIKRFDFNQRHAPNGCRKQALTLRMVHQVTRASVTQRLDLIRIRLLRSQLEELYKIKNLLERRMIEQHEREEEQKAKHKLEQDKRQKELEEEEHQAKERLAELERIRLMHLEQREHQREVMQNEQSKPELKEVEEERRVDQTLDLKLESKSERGQGLEAKSVTKPESGTPQSGTVALANAGSEETDENRSPPAFYTPEEEKNKKEKRHNTIQEEEDDDLVPSIKTTPPRSYPRQSIGQWSVERAKNNMSVRSMVTSLEVKVGPKHNSRSRIQK